MALDSKLFSDLQKKSSDSFFQQKSLIKRVMAGKKVQCQQCGQAIGLTAAKGSEKLNVSCKKGCTDIELDIDV